MRNCGWYLWLNGKKIYNIRELRENFDTAVLSGYFLGGSLMKWLSDLGEYTILKRLSEIDSSRNIGIQLEFAFGVSPDRTMPTDTEIKPLYPVSDITVEKTDTGMNDVIMYSGSFNGSISSFSPVTETDSSFQKAVVSSFIPLFESNSGYAYESSYAAFVSGQAVNMIQSSGGSFSFSFKNITGISGGSFTNISGSSFMNMLWWSKNFGSYGTTHGGSFRSLFGWSKWMSGSYKGIFTGSFLLSMYGGSFFFSSGMYSSGDILNALFGSSFTLSVNGVTITAEEYRRTLINLTSCPLNAYGYGINLV